MTFHQDLHIGDPEGVLWQFGTCQAAMANRRMTTVLHLYPSPPLLYLTLPINHGLFGTQPQSFPQ